ncbi:MAG: glutamate-5-semialdehyde dehydrogenase [Magnetococcales bacterium]|nr:glutamate-5-semialdehyde dehydrogenase [Magnetococcales bacterium]NGZ29206.1 glutamate-5-semialdehyde dehydrogenase [Magnetococcales bacterium]
MMNTMDELVESLAKASRQASRQLGASNGAARNRALEAMARGLLVRMKDLRESNEEDLAAARASGMSEPMIDRLRLSEEGIEAMVEGLHQVVALPDPVGEITELRRRPNGMLVGRMRVPLGVIGVIYESRPNVTADAAALCVKSGNSVILRGGTEAYHTNKAIATCLSEGLAEEGLPSAAVQMVPVSDREAVGSLLRCDKYVDVIIPRGGKSLISRVVAESRIPVIKHLDGICHTYVDSLADLDMASDVVFNAKMQRTAVCNATETLLVHQAVAADFLPMAAMRLVEAGCQLRVCPETAEILQGVVDVLPAKPEDYDTEFLAAILAVKVVENMEEALEHIEAHSSRHTESIITRDMRRAMRFLREVDSSAVMVNASTRFNDGFQFGLGAEMGISTDKLHVRGPVGLEGLTTLKYVVMGDGHLRQ